MTSPPRPIGPVDAFQRKHPVISFPIAVVYKYFDDQGPYLAAIIAYYAFIAIFPLLLLGSSILGFVLQDNPDLRKQLLDSALSQFPIIGTQLGQTTGPQGQHDDDRHRLDRRALRCHGARPGGPERRQHRLVRAAQQPGQSDHPATAQHPLPRDQRCRHPCPGHRHVGAREPERAGRRSRDDAALGHPAGRLRADRGDLRQRLPAHQPRPGRLAIGAAGSDRDGRAVAGPAVGRQHVRPRGHQQGQGTR